MTAMRAWALLAVAAAAIVCVAVVSQSVAPQVTELHESSDMREIDKMLNRIHKITKHGYDGEKEPAHHTKLAEAHHEAEKKKKKEKKAHAPHITETPSVHATIHHHHEAHKSDDDTRPKRMALHRLAHKAQVQHAAHHIHEAHKKKHVNKALEEAMDAEKAAMHSDVKKKQSQASKAKQRTIEKKMQKLQAQITKDFSTVTGFGKKAGYLPPVKMPHM